MPPGCGRVVITHRSIRFTMSSVTAPMLIGCPTQPSSSEPATVTFGRKRRTSQPARVSSPMIETCVRVESWNEPFGPSHRTHSSVSSCSKSSAIS